MNNKEFIKKWSDEIGNNIYHSAYVKDFINDLDNLDNWISVDELPKIDDVYLVCHKNKEFSIVHFNLRLKCWAIVKHNTNPITHWQPIKPPKEKK